MDLDRQAAVQLMEGYKRSGTWGWVGKHSILVAMGLQHIVSQSAHQPATLFETDSLV